MHESILLELVFRHQKAYEKGSNEPERVLTTQKVSHPPVRPKYGAFAPARLLLNTAMAQWMDNGEHERKRLDRDEKEKTEAK